MLYAVLYTILINGIPYTLVEPMLTLSQCRAVAKVMYENRNETYPDAQCVAIIQDRG